MEEGEVAGGGAGTPQGTTAAGAEVPTSRDEEGAGGGAAPQRPPCASSAGMEAGVRAVFRSPSGGVCPIGAPAPAPAPHRALEPPPEAAPNPRGDERPPRAFSADMDEVHTKAAAAREASGDGLAVIDGWRGMVFRSPSGGVYPVGADAPVDGGEEEDAASPFDWLPNEMLSAVLAWLDWETLLVAAPAVCRTWRAVCRDLVPAVFEFPQDVRLGDGVLRAIGARFRKARGVALGYYGCDGGHRVTSEAVGGLFMQCRQLRRLELTSCRVDMAALAEALKTNSTLTSLECVR